MRRKRRWEVNIIAYTYEADVHCVECAKKRFASSLGIYPPARTDRNGIGYDQEDAEGNEVRPVLSTDEQSLEPPHCGDCRKLD